MRSDLKGRSRSRNMRLEVRKLYALQRGEDAGVRSVASEELKPRATEHAVDATAGKRLRQPDASKAVIKKGCSR